MPVEPIARPTGDSGLSSDEAAQLQARHGPNVVPRGPRRSVAARVGDQLRDPMILLLLGATVLVAAVGDVSDAAIILAVVCLNTLVGVVQDVRAANALDALERLATPEATVVRDGRVVRLPAAALVPGDRVRLRAGDVVPADVLLVRTGGVEVDESAMTGESVPVGRGTDDELLAGTVLTRGRTDARVLRTGAGSALGAIAAAVVAAGTRPTPLQRRLARLSAQLVWWSLAVAVLVVVLGVARGQRLVDVLVLAVSLAVAAIPESLPAVVTVALALGAYRMARRHALVRRLPAVETLGSVTVLATDKTGTLTEGRMTAREIWTPAGGWRLTGAGYAAAGSLVPTGPAGRSGPAELELLLRDLVLCNDARLSGPEGGEWGVVGDPMEAALLVAAGKRDRALLALPEAWRRVAEAPFESATKRMVTLHRRGDRGLLVCKGAPEAVLPMLEDARARTAAEDAVRRLADHGYRLLAVADAVVEGSTDAVDVGAPRDLELRGVVALVDPARPSARQVVADCRAAGIRTVMITGDHPATARAIADDLTITTQTPGVATGEEVARGEHAARVTEIGIYARTRPEDKVAIVAAWQAHGAVVAMTGDGVNDAPALRNADIGVAMGDRGTDVARQAADLVLADDDLRTVVAAVQEGRRIYTNIRRFLRYGLSGGLAEVLVLLAAPWLGMPLPLTPAQILWINMVTHGLPGVAFGGEPADPRDMRRPSPSPERSVLDGLLTQILATATVIATVAVVAGLAVPEADRQTMVFWCLALGQLWLALALRAPRRGSGWRARGLEVAVLGAGLLVVLAVAWPPLHSLLDTRLLSATQLVAGALAAAVPALGVAALHVARPAGPMTRVPGPGHKDPGRARGPRPTVGGEPGGPHAAQHPRHRRRRGR